MMPAVWAATARGLDRVLRGMPATMARRVGAEDIRDGVLKQFDVAIFPGGSGSKQASALNARGRAAVQAFVNRGGGYVGICAGSYLAAANYSWSLGISNHKTFCETIDLPGIGRKSMWYRGPSATVKMELTKAGRYYPPHRHHKAPRAEHPSWPSITPAMCHRPSVNG